MAEPSEASETGPVHDPRPWWRRPAAGRGIGVLYLALGAAQLINASLDHDHAHWLIGSIWLLGGIAWLARPVTVLRDGVLQVPQRWFRRRRVDIGDIERFAVPHPFDTTLHPSAVLLTGERVRIPDVTTTVLQRWSEATGIPVVRDPKPPPPPPSQRAALS